MLAAVQSMTVLFQTYSLSQLLPPAHLPLFVLFSHSLSVCTTFQLQMSHFPHYVSMSLADCVIASVVSTAILSKISTCH